MKSRVEWPDPVTVDRRRKRIEATLAVHDLTHAEAAAGLGVHPVTFSYMLHGRMRFPPERLAQLERIVGLPAGYFDQPAPVPSSESRP